MFPKLMLFTLLCVHVAVAGTGNSTDTGFGKTFSASKDNTDDFKDLFYGDLDDGLLKPNLSSVRGHNVTNFSWWLSEDARQFLTSPISTILIPSFYTLVFLISVPINFTALMAFAHEIRPKKPAAIYMLNLACADLIFALMLPFKVIYHFCGNDWSFPPILCRVVNAAFYWNMYCTVLLIACISMDRLLAVVYPIDSLAWRRPRNSVIACTTMWVLSLAGSVPLVLSEQTFKVEQLNITTCHDVQSTDTLNDYYRYYFLALCCALFVLLLLVTVASYSRVIWSLSRVPRGIPGRSRRRTRAIVMAVTVMVIFILCFAPTNFLLLAHYMQFNSEVRSYKDAPDNSYAAYLVFLCLGSLNCLLDPLLYYFGSSQCQRQLSRALRCNRNPEDITSRSSRGSSRNSACRSSSKPIQKSSRNESSEMSSFINKDGVLQKSQDDQNKKLLV